MPESKKRKDVVERRKEKARREQEAPKLEEKRSPRWWVPLMITLATIGLIFVVIAYVSGGQYPIPGLSNGNINLFIGIGFILVGFLMTLGWR